MTTYGYISAQPGVTTDVEAEIKNYATKNNLSLESVSWDKHTNKMHWTKRMIFDMINSAEKGTEIVVYEASDIGRSTSQVLEAFEMFLENGIILHLVKYQQRFTSERAVDIKNFLRDGYKVGFSVGGDF